MNDQHKHSPLVHTHKKQTVKQDRITLTTEQAVLVSIKSVEELMKEIYPDG